MSYPQGPWGQVPQVPVPQRDRRRDAFFLSLLVVPFAAMCLFGIATAIIEEPERRAERERRLAAEQAAYTNQALATAQQAAANAAFSDGAIRQFLREQGVREYQSAIVEADGILVVRVEGASMNRGLEVCNWLILHAASPARSFRRVEVKALDNVLLAGGFQERPCVRGDAPTLRQMGF